MHDDLWQQAVHRGLSKSGALLLVHSQTQHMRLLLSGEHQKSWPISTSRFGLGKERDSFKTPRGWHECKEFIGAGEPADRIFKDRLPQKIRYDHKIHNPEHDIILARIIRLSGLEPSLNQGGDTDSFSRYIYIHGTPQEHALGTPASSGCIRMRPLDIIDLFETTHHLPSTYTYIQ